MTTLTVYRGRDNADRLKLLIDDVVVADNTITKAQLKFGDYCLDTSVDSNIRLTDSATVVEVEIGLTTALATGLYKGKLTAYDVTATNGIAWADLEIDIQEWNVCG